MSKKKKSKKATTDAKKAAKPARHSLGEGGATEASKEPTPEKQANTGQPRGNGAKRASGLDAAVQVLSEAGEPMSCKAMVEKMLTQGLWQTKGKSPASTIYAAIIREIAAKGEKARFKKTDRGKFVLNK